MHIEAGPRDREDQVRSDLGVVSRPKGQGARPRSQGCISRCTWLRRFSRHFDHAPGSISSWIKSRTKSTCTTCHSSNAGAAAAAATTAATTAATHSTHHTAHHTQHTAHTTQHTTRHAQLTAHSTHTHTQHDAQHNHPTFREQDRARVPFLFGEASGNQRRPTETSGHGPL